MIQVNRLSNVINLATKNDCKFLLNWWTNPSILKLKNIYIDSYKDAPYCRVTVLAKSTTYLYYLWKHNFRFEFEYEIAGIWTGISGTKSGYAKHWATINCTRVKFFHPYNFGNFIWDKVHTFCQCQFIIEFIIDILYKRSCNSNLIMLDILCFQSIHV